jgi:hypothetical protein
MGGVICILDSMEYNFFINYFFSDRKDTNKTLIKKKQSVRIVQFLHNRTK